MKVALSLSRGPAREFAFVAFFVAATIVLTWPIAISLDRPTTIRGDFFNNIWNAWWMRTALFQQHVSPYWTDYLHFPEGISLAQHTLSPVNSIAGALASYVCSPVVVFNLVLLAHYALGGWGAFLLARYLTGNVPGALLAGLIYTFSPFHYFYFAQINVGSIGFLPIAVLWFVRAYREGGRRNVVMVAVMSVLLVASAEYYLVYAYIVAGLLAVAGRLVDPAVPVAQGVRRVFVAGACGGLAVIVVAWPLLAASLAGGDAASAEHIDTAVQTARSNDLFGFNWVGPPERIVVSWPTMIGYSTLVLLLVGWREVVKQRFLLLVLGVFLVLGFGTSLAVGGESTRMPMPYALLEKLPVLSMLRKADRSFVVVQMVVAMLVAFAWRGIDLRLRQRTRSGANASGPANARSLVARSASNVRIGDPGSAAIQNAEDVRPQSSRMPAWLDVRAPLWCACALIPCIELTGVPFALYRYELSPLLERLAADTSVRALVELPPTPGDAPEGRYNYAQTVHHKRMPQGYTTSSALTRQHIARGVEWMQAYKRLSAGDAQALVRLLDERGIDIVLLEKTVPKNRAPVALDRSTVWRPFFFVRRQLVGLRQAGGVIDGPIAPETLAVQVEALTKALGPSTFEDARVVVFRRSR